MIFVSMLLKLFQFQSKIIGLPLNFSFCNVGLVNRIRIFSPEFAKLTSKLLILLIISKNQRCQQKMILRGNKVFHRNLLVLCMVGQLVSECQVKGSLGLQFSFLSSSSDIFHSSVLFSNFHLILQTLSIFSSSSAPRSLPPSSSSTSFKSSSEPVLKKLRTSPASYEDDEGEEGSSVQMHGFTDDIHTRYIVPSYTATSPSITQSMPYIQMKNTENTLLKERISRTGLTQIDGKSLCEYALLSILGWYVMKSLSSAPRLRGKISSQSLFILVPFIRFHFTFIAPSKKS